ncbi:WG repeat-containing protein [Leeuwenhoekiella marinoflava]|uniref:WG repeat-containing protein n=1 Tax=Leeuwenhoekiella marinoflava TaxID=988 RepID=UPI00300370BD
MFRHTGMLSYFKIRTGITATMDRTTISFGQTIRRVLIILMGVFTTLQTTRAQDSVAYQTPHYLIAPQREMSPFSNFSEGLARYGKNYNTFGYINTDGAVAITAEFYDAGDFHDGRAWVAKRDTVTGNLVYGFIDKKGNLRVDYRYEDAGDFASERAPVKINGEWHYIDKKGKVVFKPIQNRKHRFYNGLVLQEKNGKYGYLDKNGAVRIPFIYEEARDFADGRAIVEKESGVLRNQKNTPQKNALNTQRGYQYLVIDTLGTEVFDFPKHVIRISDFSDGIASFYKMQDDNSTGQWGLLDKDGHVVMEAQFSNQPFAFSDGIGMVQIDGKRPDNRDALLVTLNQEGQIIAKIPFTNTQGYRLYTSAARFQEGMLAVRMIDVQGNDLWTYMDKNGQLRFDLQFSHARNFYEGFAIVVLAENGKIGFLKNPLEDKD